MEAISLILSFLFVIGLIGTFSNGIKSARAKPDSAEGTKYQNGMWVFFGIFLFSVCTFFSTDLFYKRGQIDALTGKIKYELKINPDSTKSWEEIKKTK